MKKIKKTELILSIILSILLLFGYAIDKISTIDVLFKNKYILISFLSFIILTVIIYYLLKILFYFFNNINREKSNNKIYNFIFEKHPIIAPFIITFILGLPIIILFYPGTIQWDGMKQLDYFFGVIPWTNHHPAFSTLIMGLCVKIGRMLGSDNLGIFFYTFTQYILYCFTLGYIFKFMKEINAPKNIRIITFLFFILNPIWYINAYTVVKDTAFYLIFIIYFISYINYYYNTTNKNYIMLLIFSLLLILFRNNGLYIVLLTYVILFIRQYKSVNKIKNMSFIIIVIIFQLLYSCTLSIFNISGGNIREMLSLPIQQTARYVSKYNVDTKDKQILEYTFNTSLETIKDKYNPELSDPVKFMFNVKNKNELINYLKVYFKEFKIHPKVYVDAFLENYYGYFYPLKKEVKDGVAWFDIIQSKRVNTGYFNFYMDDKYENSRNNIINIITYIRNLPVISLLFNTGIYTYILLIAIGYSFKNKKYNFIIISTPLIITLLFCFLSPVNAYLRYMNPIIVTLPIFIGLILSMEEYITK